LELTPIHVNATVLVHQAGGMYDVLGNGPYDQDPNWPAEAEVSANVIIFLAQSAVDQAGVPAVDTAFCSTPVNPGQWDTNFKEIYLEIGQIQDSGGSAVNINSKHLIRKSGLDADDADTRPTLGSGNITATDFVMDPDTGLQALDQWTGVASPDDLIINTNTNFIIEFNKPVVPDTVGRSFVFNRAPFEGNIRPIDNPIALQWPAPPECSQWIFSICPNIELKAYFLDINGAVSNVKTPVPFRVYPLHQNNLATYVINPIIDIPGSSSDWNKVGGSVPAPDASDIRMRLEIIIFDYKNNWDTGDPDGALTQPPTPGIGPENLSPGGFHGERFQAIDPPNANQYISRTFSVLAGRRYVNAPVSPNTVYFTMGADGIGAVDLDGNGFTTNTPGSGVPQLVTNVLNYNQFGSVSQGTGNAYSYPVGLGMETPIPGVNEGSSGMNTLVRASDGSSKLYSDPDGSSYNISDVELGDFLDTIYYDRSNAYLNSAYRTDFVFFGAPGNFNNNMISAPPTPNPPPLTIPVGMKPLDIILDNFSILEENAFTIMGKEVFTVDIAYAGSSSSVTYIHLGIGGSSPDYGLPPKAPGTFAPILGLPNPSNFIQSGPLCESCTFGVILGMPTYYASRQQIGNFLFAADNTNNDVKVLNSNTMEVIARLQGLRGPDSVAVTPDLRTLYVSNNAGDSVSVFDVDPRSAEFLQNIATIWVGRQPRGIGCQPDYEDVFVCNYGGNSISVINPSSNTIRKTLTALIKKPTDVVAAPRQMGYLGWGTQVYHAYISNTGDDNVLVYESGPSGLGGIGYDNILDPVPSQGMNGQQFETIHKPQGICYDPGYLNNQSSALNLVGGCYVAHASTKGAAVSRIMFIDQQAPWGPIYLIPNSGSIGGTPGFGARRFLITSQWTAQDGHLSATGSDQASDVCLPDFNVSAWENNNFAANPYVTNYGAVGQNPVALLPINNKHPLKLILGSYVPTLSPDRLYISYKNTRNIDVLDPLTGSVDTITNLEKPAKKLKAFYKN